MNKKLDDKLGLSGMLVPMEEKPVAVQKAENDEQQQEQDFNMARDNIINTLQQLNAAVPIMFEIAKDKEDGKSFEALNGLLKSTLEASKDILELHQRKKNLKKQQEAANQSVNIQNAVFTGSSKDLRALIADLKQKKADGADGT